MQLGGSGSCGGTQYQTATTATTATATNSKPANRHRMSTQSKATPATHLPILLQSAKKSLSEYERIYAQALEDVAQAKEKAEAAAREVKRGRRMVDALTAQIGKSQNDG